MNKILFLLLLIPFTNSAVYAQENEGVFRDSSVTLLSTFTSSVQPNGIRINDDYEPGADILRFLKGEFAGVEVQPVGGVTGSGNNIIIRNYTSVNGNNQPLILVDGIRFDGGVNAFSGMFSGGGTLISPNRSLDLNPENISKVTVLKSLMATAIYGESARNGVILIETRTGDFSSLKDEPGFVININQSLYTSEISSRPDYTNSYGNGFNGLYDPFVSNWGPSFNATDAGLFGAEFIRFENDGTVLVEHPLLVFDDADQYFPDLVSQPYVYGPKTTPTEEFFKKGLGTNTGLSIYGSIEDVNINLNYLHATENGFTPGNELVKNNFGIGINFDVTEKLKNRTFFNLALTDLVSPVLAAYGGSGPPAQGGGSNSLFGYVFFTPRSIDLNMPFQNPVTNGSIYYRPGNGIPHPRWVSEFTGTSNNTNRYYGKTDFDFRISERIKLNYRLSFDIYSESQEYRQNPGGIIPLSASTGLYQTTEYNQTTFEHTLTGLSSYALTSDVQIDALIGVQHTRIEQDRKGLQSQNMINFDSFLHSNFTQQSSINIFTGEAFGLNYENTTGGVFANLNFGYREAVFLDLAFRAEKIVNPYQLDYTTFYPAAGFSYIPSKQSWFNIGWINKLKLHSSVGWSARSLLSAEEIRISNDRRVRLNPDLETEKIAEFEAGLNAGFFSDRVRLSTAYYHRNISDFIIRSPLPVNTGFNSTYLNQGEMKVNGLELTLGITPVRTEVLWNVRSVFHRSESEFGNLNENILRVPLGDGFLSRGNFVMDGQPYGVLVGTQIARVTEDIISSNPVEFRNAQVGDPLINFQGNYLNGNVGVIGDPNPDWTMSVFNELSYKTWSLSFQFDFQKGGDMYSSWISTMIGRGMTTYTDERDETFILDGVDVISGERNEIEISANQYFFNNIGFGPDENRVYDMSHIRLSQVSLSWGLPANFLEDVFLRDVTLSFSATNLWLNLFNVPDEVGFDPAVSSSGAGVNGSGFEYFTGPGVRRFGGKISISL